MLPQGTHGFPQKKISQFGTHIANKYLYMSEDVRIVEDRALGMYPNSVYALYTFI